MKNVAMFRRFESNVSRMYELPLDAEVKPGSIVSVDYVTGSTAIAYAVSRNYIVKDDETAEMVANLFQLHSGTLNNLKKVRSIYLEEPCVYPDELPDSEATPEQEEG